MDIYTKPAKGPIVLACALNTTDATCIRTQAYITKALLIVELTAPIWDLPDEILCRFPANEHTPRPHQAYRLTKDLYEKVLRNVESVNPASMSPADMALMDARIREIVEVFERLPKFSVMADV